MSIYKDVITLKITMDDRGIMAVQIRKTFQDLSHPVLDSSHVHCLVPLPVPVSKTTHDYYNLNISEKRSNSIRDRRRSMSYILLSERAGSEHLGDEVERPAISVDPGCMESHYGGVIKIL